MIDRAIASGNRGSCRSTTSTRTRPTTSGRAAPAGRHVRVVRDEPRKSGDVWADGAMPTAEAEAATRERYAARSSTRMKRLAPLGVARASTCSTTRSSSSGPIWRAALGAQASATATIWVGGIGRRRRVLGAESPPQGLQGRHRARGHLPTMLSILGLDGEIAKEDDRARCRHGSATGRSRKTSAARIRR
jgi:hypothetical protein